MLLLRSVAFAAGQTVSTVVFALAGLLASPLPYRWRYRLITGWTHVNLWWLEVTCGLRCRIEGLERVPEQPSVVLCKHQSAWETMALQRIFNPQVWVMKREILWIPFFGWGIALLRPIAIDRGGGRRAVEQLIRQGLERLEEGCWVVVFPEGTRTAPGTKGRYHKGGAALAKRAGRAVVPVAHDAGDFWPRRSFVKRPGTIRLVIGPPIPTHGRSATEVNREAEAWIERTVAALRADAAAGRAR